MQFFWPPQSFSFSSSPRWHLHGSHRWRLLGFDIDLWSHLFLRVKACLQTHAQAKNRWWSIPDTTRCAACLSHLALAISCESFRGCGCKQGPLVSLTEMQGHDSENPTPLLQVTRGGKPVACLNDTLAAPVSNLQLSRHVVDMISAREQVSFNPQGIWATREPNEKQTWLQVPFALLLGNGLKGVFDFREKFGRALVRKVVSLPWFLVKRLPSPPTWLLPHTFKYT